MYEELVPPCDAPDDLGSLILHIVKLIPYKLILFVFIGYILINTSTFVDRILNTWPGTVEGRIPTEKGLLGQAIILSLGLIVFSVLVNSDMV